MKRMKLAAAAMGVAALAVAPVTSVDAAKKKHPKPVKSQVGDDYYTPLKMTVKPGTKITWKWLSGNSNTHDVKLKKGPKGVKKFQSDPAASFYSYSRTLTKKGKYSIICTFHEGMVQTITVR